MAQQDSYRIGPGLRDKLREVVRTVDALTLSSRGPDTRTVHQSVPGRQQAGVFRICTFTGSWSKTSTKTVTFKYQTATPNTVVATNLFAEIGTAAQQTRNCAIAREGTAWFLISAEC